MAIEIPDDGEVQPASPAPAAVVRRRGESYDDLQLRKQGFSGDKLNPSGALNHAAGVAIAREKRLSDAEARRKELEMKGADLRQKQYELQVKSKQDAMEDKQAKLDQTAQLYSAIDGVAAKYPRGTKDFYEKALPLFHQFPNADGVDKRYAHYEQELVKAGSSPEKAAALWELGQIDPRDHQADGWLREIPGKYPNAFAAPEVRGMHIELSKQAQANLQRTPTAPPGMVVKEATITTPGGTMKVEPDNGNAAKVTAKTQSTKPNPVELYQDALAVSQPIYGTGSDLKSFAPTVAGTAQTHVKVAFQDPKGKPQEMIMERGLFDSMVAASQARKQAQGDGGKPPNKPQATATATGEVDPADSFNTDSEVKVAYKAGKLTREQAEAVLKTKFGHK